LGINAAPAAASKVNRPQAGVISVLVHFVALGPNNLNQINGLRNALI
jgi:hypothetical protein